MYAFLAFWYFVGIVIALRIVRSPVGAILSAIRDNPLRAAARRPQHPRLQAHRLRRRRGLCRLCRRACSACMQGFMPPDAFMFDTSGQLVMQTAIGGAGTLFGPLVGADGMALSQRFLSEHAASRRDLEARARRRVRAAGLLPAARHDRRRSWTSFAIRRASATREPQRPPGREHDGGAEADRRLGRSPKRRRCRRGARTARRSGPILQATGLTKRYGGLVANSDIDFTVDHGELRGIIGPNGAGKTHFLQDADLRGAADLRQDRVRRPRHHRHERDRRLPARPHQELSGQPAVHAADGTRRT